MARHRLARLLVAALVAVALAAAGAHAAPAHAASTADRLVLQPDDVPALTPVAASAPAARRALARVLARGADGAPRPIRTEAAAYAGPDGRLLQVQAFVFRTPALARAAARAWERGQGRSGLPARAGATGARMVSDLRADEVRVAALRRDGAVVSQIVYRSPATLDDAVAAAGDYVRSAARRVTDVAARSATDRVMDGVRADGTIPLPTLLQLAALVYGPVDGVKLPPGSRDEPPPIDATTLASELTAVAPSLTRAQRRALGRVMSVATRVPAARARAPREYGSCQVAPDGRPLDVGHTEQVRALRDLIAHEIPGIGFTPSWHVCVYNYTEARGMTNAETAPWSTTSATSPFHPSAWDDGFRYVGDQDECFIGLFPGFFATTRQNQQMQLAHEAYHCVHQEWLRGTIFVDDRSPWWVEESMANWAGHDISPGTYEPTDQVPGMFIRAWNSRWSRTLMDQGYIAWGFWGLVEQVVGSGAMWSRIAPMWAVRNDTPAAYAAMVGGSDSELLDLWGAAINREPTFPPAWLQRLPFTVPDPGNAERSPALSAVPGAPARFTVSNYAARKLVVHGAEAPLVQVTIEGNGRITDGHQDWLHPSGMWFCFEGRCSCPQGQHLRTALPSYVTIGRSLYAGIAASSGRSTLIVEGHSMDEYCIADPCPVRQHLTPPSRPPRGLLADEVCEPSRPPGGGPTPGGGTTHNDPHLVTFDGVAYDFQSAGEFVLARAEDGSFEVQVRQEPADDLGLATSNTAVAVRTDGHRIAVYGPPDREPTLRVDGAVRALAREGRIEVGTVHVRRYGDTYLLRAADGTQVTIDTFRRGALRITIDPADAYFGELRGTLGSYDGIAENDLATASGQIVEYTLPAGTDLRVPNFGAGVNDFQWLHGPFADSWRVRQATSLFDYRRGESAASFVDRSVPRAEVSLADLSAAARARARRACAAIADPWFRRSCERDVALTGQTGFARSASRAERDRGAWRPLDGFEARIGALSAAVAGDGTVVFAAQNAIFGAETLATAVAVPRRGRPGAPFLLEHGLVGEPSLYRAADGTIGATLPVIDLTTPTGAVRTYALDPTGVATRGADVASLTELRGPVPAAAGPGGLLTVANGFGTLDLRLGTSPATPATPAPADGTDCAPTAPTLAAGGGAVWLAWTGTFCLASGPRAMLLSPGATTPALGPLVAPGATANVLLPTQLSTSVAVRPDGAAVLAYAGEGRVLAWRAGEGEQPVELATTGERTTDVVLVAAEPTTGRVWAAWRDPAKRSLVVRQSDSEGRTFGAARSISPPILLSDLDRNLGQWTIVADDGRLIVAFAVPGSSSRSGSAWYTVLR